MCPCTNVAARPTARRCRPWPTRSKTSLLPTWTSSRTCWLSTSWRSWPATIRRRRRELKGEGAAPAPMAVDTPEPAEPWSESAPEPRAEPGACEARARARLAIQGMRCAFVFGLVRQVRSGRWVNPAERRIVVSAQ